MPTQSATLTTPTVTRGLSVTSSRPTRSPYRLGLSPAAAAPAEVRACEVEVLGRWYGDTPELLAEAYGPYEPQTVFLHVTRQDDGVVVGAARLMLPGALPLKTFTDVTGEPWNADLDTALALAGIDPARTVDLTTIAVRPELGAAGRTIAASLYHGIIRVSRVNDLPYGVAVIDRRARTLLSLVGLPMQSIPGTAPAFYMGSAQCGPAWVDIPAVVAAQRSANPEAYRLVTLGHGLADVALPADAAFAARTVTRR